MKGKEGAASGYAHVKPLIDALLEAVRARLGDRLTAVALYGSVARGEAHRLSDIDLFVVHRGAREVVSEAFLRAKLRLRDTPLARELVSQGIPAAPVAVYRSEEELADTPWLLLDVTPRHRPVRSPRRAPPEAAERQIEAAGTRFTTHRVGRRLLVLGPQTRSASRRNRHSVNHSA